MTSTSRPMPNRRPALPPNVTVMEPAFGDQLSVGQSRFVAQVLTRGGVVWLMSDCSWAGGADPRHAVGIAALDVALDHHGNPIPLTAADEKVAATIIRFDATARLLTARFWPGGLGLTTRPATRFACRVAKNLHCADGSPVVRVSRSVIERQVSATLGLPITSAAMREQGVLITDEDEALTFVRRLSEERLPYTPMVFIRSSTRATVKTHSTMVSLHDGIRPLRHGSVEVTDVFKAALSNDGVDWSDAT